MKSMEEANFRLKLANGYVQEAKRVFEASPSRACVGSCQLAVENACNAVIALFKPPVRGHDLSGLLLDLSTEKEFTQEEMAGIEKLADWARILGLEEHIFTDYGDELTHKSPWEVYKEEHARRVLGIGTWAVKIAEGIVQSR